MEAIERGFTYLNEILSFCFRDQRLEFGSRESIYQTSFGNYKKKYLSSSQYRQFVGLSKC